MANIPLVNLQKQHANLIGEILPEIEAVVRQGNFINGQPVRDLEREFAEFCGAARGVGVSSGTAALSLALEALGVGPGDEVITQANTFVATPEAIRHCGATPVFVDSGAYFQIDASKIEEKITDKTKVLLPVHLYGHPAPMDEILAIAEKHGLIVLEDACQAHGAKYKDKPAGSFGRAACFSFYPGKNLGAIGDGGMVVTSDNALADKIKLLSDHGSPKKYVHDIVGYTHRLDTIQAVALRAKLKRLDHWNASRRRLASMYNEALADIEEVETPEMSPDAEAVFHLYVVRAKERDSLLSYLNDSGIGAGIHYPVICPRHASMAGCGQGSFPVADACAGEILSLPIFPEMTVEEVQTVAAAVAAFYKHS